MARTAKVLGQSNPAAVTLTTLYTVPALTATTCSTVVVCNQSAVAAKFRLAVAVAGAADTAKQYLYYDVSVPANDSFAATIGITLATTDLVRVYASTASLSFSLFGIEVV